MISEMKRSGQGQNITLHLPGLSADTADLIQSSNWSVILKLYSD